MSQRRRRATHADSWYESSAERLRGSLTKWLEDASQEAAVAHSGGPRVNGTCANAANGVHAVIAPHAGYAYSGSTAAHAYAAIDARMFSRVIILGPSHHVYLKDRCAVSNAHVLETPLGGLQVDREVIDGLLEHSSREARFVTMGDEMDEAEHSIEMHLPYIRHVFQGVDVKVVPIVVGSLSEDKERQFGKMFAPWLGDGETFFIISSDFCHWGTRFRYTRVDREARYIWQSIEQLDREGMQVIESGNHGEFIRYQQRTENTVCGRHPIGVLMSALAYCSAHCNCRFVTNFVKYKQSSRCVKMSDSSVSYASALVQTCDDAVAVTSGGQQQQQQQHEQSFRGWH